MCMAIGYRTSNWNREAFSLVAFLHLKCTFSYLVPLASSICASESKIDIILHMPFSEQCLPNQSKIHSLCYILGFYKLYFCSYHHTYNYLIHISLRGGLCLLHLCIPQDLLVKLSGPSGLSLEILIQQCWVVLASIPADSYHQVRLRNTGPTCS